MVDKKHNNILYVIHSGTAGGTFNTNLDLMKNVKENFNIYLLGAEQDYLMLYHFSDNQLQLLNKFPRNLTWSAKIFHDSWLNYVYFEILTRYNIDLVHIRHLIYHSFDLPQIAKKLDIPVVLSFHDFYFVCPNYFLLDENFNYCEGKCPENNENCKLLWDIFDDLHFKTFLPMWRKNVEELFKNVDIFVTTSNFVKDVFLSIYTDETTINDSNFIIIEHGRDFPKIDTKLYELPSKDKPLKIAFPANHINITKGLEVIKNIKKLDYQNNFEFHFLGDVPSSLKNYGIIHGTYVRDDFHKCIEKIKPSFIGVFSIWPETYCHTITESWSCGIPVIGTNIGVIEDRILKHGGGVIIDKDDFYKSYNDILNLKSISENSYLNLIDNVSKIYLKTTLEMSKEYIDIYNNLLNR